MKKCQKVRKSAKNYETILPFRCCPLVFPWTLVASLARGSHNLIWESFEPVATRPLVGCHEQHFTSQPWPVNARSWSARKEQEKKNHNRRSHKFPVAHAPRAWWGRTLQQGVLSTFWKPPFWEPPSGNLPSENPLLRTFFWEPLHYKTPSKNTTFCKAFCGIWEPPSSLLKVKLSEFYSVVDRRSGTYLLTLIFCR